MNGQLMIMETQRGEIHNVMKHSHWQYMIIIVFAKRIAEGDRHWLSVGWQ